MSSAVIAMNLPLSPLPANAGTGEAKSSDQSLRKIAAFMEIGGLQSRPICDHPAALDRAAGEQCDGPSRAIGAFPMVVSTGEAARILGDHSGARNEPDMKNAARFRTDS